MERTCVPCVEQIDTGERLEKRGAKKRVGSEGKEGKK